VFACLISFLYGQAVGMLSKEVLKSKLFVAAQFVKLEKNYEVSLYINEYTKVQHLLERVFVNKI